MITIIQITLGLIATIILIGIVWRFSSNRLTIPCPSWLGWMVERDNPFTKTNRAKEIIKHLELKQGMIVLDAGCGPGRLTIPVSKEIGPNGTVVALDIQSGMLDRVKEKALKANLNNIQLLQEKIEDGILDQDKYDRALLVTVLGEIPNREIAMKEIFRVIKPGGILVVTEVIFDPHFQSKKTVLQLAKAAGFVLRKTIGNRLAFTMQFKKP